MLESFESIIKNLKDLKAYKSQMILRKDDLNDIGGLDAGIAKSGTEKKHSSSSDKSQNSTDNSSDFIPWRDNLDDVLSDVSNEMCVKLLLEAGKVRGTLHQVKDKTQTSRKYSLPIQGKSGEFFPWHDVVNLKSYRMKKCACPVERCCQQWAFQNSLSPSQ